MGQNRSSGRRTWRADPSPISSHYGHYVDTTILQTFCGTCEELCSTGRMMRNISVTESTSKEAKRSRSLFIHHRSCDQLECEFHVFHRMLRKNAKELFGQQNRRPSPVPPLGCPENSFYNLWRWVILLFHFAKEEIEVLRGHLA